MNNNLKMETNKYFFVIFFDDKTLVVKKKTKKVKNLVWRFVFLL